MFGTNFNHCRNLHNSSAPPPQQPPPQPAGPLCPVTAACGRMAGCPMYPVDMGINIASLRAQIDGCKRRYQREVWNVLCGKALENGESWKKQDDPQDEESKASAKSGSENAKQAPAAAGHGNATSTGAGSTVGSGGEKSEEVTTEEDQTQPENAEEKSAEEEVTTDEAANENNRNKLAATRRRSASGARRGPQSQTRRLGGNSSNSVGPVDRLNRSKGNERRQAGVALPRQPQRKLQSAAVEFSDRHPPVGSRTSRPSKVVSERRRDDDGEVDDESDSSDDCSYSRRRTNDLVDNCSFGSSESSELDDLGQARRRFVPIFCGNWAAAGVGRASRKLRSSRLRRLSRGLSVTYQEPMPTPAGERAARI